MYVNKYFPLGLANILFPLLYGECSISGGGGGLGLLETLQFTFSGRVFWRRLAVLEASGSASCQIKIGAKLHIQFKNHNLPKRSWVLALKFHADYVSLRQLLRKSKNLYVFFILNFKHTYTFNFTSFRIGLHAVCDKNFSGFCELVDFATILNL